MKRIILPGRINFRFLPVLILVFSNSCGYREEIKPAKPSEPATEQQKGKTPEPVTKPPELNFTGDPNIVLSRKQVPILCYHQVRDYRATDSKTARDYIIPPAVFRDHIKVLADSGYHTVLPDQLYSYLVNGSPLPDKPVMLSFDDTDLEQFTVAVPAMKEHGFKGVFFIMTVSLGRPHYMSKEQVKQLADEGHAIGSHTWDHHNIKKYTGEDWVTQIEKPSRLLETITGRPIIYFAYPFGLWNKEAIPELKKRGIRAAFQLADKRDPLEPLYTIRRIIAPGSLSGQAMLARMKASFK